MVSVCRIVGMFRRVLCREEYLVEPSPLPTQLNLFFQVLYLHVVLRTVSRLDVEGLTVRTYRRRLVLQPARQVIA